MKKLAKYLRPYWYLALISPLMMIGEVVADLFHPKLMSVIVDCGIVGSADISDYASASAIMHLFCGDGPYTSMQIILCIGITMLVLVIIGGFFVAVGILLGKNDLICLAAAMMAGALAFLLFNYHPARIFMGDTGSLFFGAMAIGCAILSGRPLLLLLTGIVYYLEGKSYARGIFCRIMEPLV